MSADEEKKAPAELTVEEAEALSKHDLTQKIIPFLDRHMVVPILHFLKESGMYKQSDIIRAEIGLLEGTNMVDYVIDLYAELNEEAPATLVERRNPVVEKLEATKQRVMPLLQILEDPERHAKIKPEVFGSIAEMCKDFGLETDIVDGLASYAKMVYDCGEYALTNLCLKHYKSIMDLEKDKPLVSAIWGSLASAILQKEFKEVTEIIQKLDEMLTNEGGHLAVSLNKREILMQRTWMLHWSLFAIFRADKASEPILQFFIEEKSLSIIALSCPYLFRYVGACLILQKRIKHLMKDTVWIMHHEANNYSDPITRFLLALYTDLDFDAAQEALLDCKPVCQADFYLAPHWEAFEENARLLIFEIYCRIHQSINIISIATKLNMTGEEAELWIVKLIQNAKLDARIDSDKKRVVMSKAPASVYHQVIEKTKNLSFKSKMLLANLEKREKERQTAQP